MTEREAPGLSGVRRVKSARRRYLTGRFPRGGGSRTLQQFSLRCDRSGDRLLIAPVGELDLATAWQLERQLRLAATSDAFEILLDLGGLSFIDSVGLKVVVDAVGSSHALAARLIILPGPDAVHRTFERCGLVTRLPFDDRAPGMPLP